MQFPNGYSISIIDNGYGSQLGKLEALVYFTGNRRADVPAATLEALGMPINPQGWLTGSQALELATRVAELPAIEGESKC